MEWNYSDCGGDSDEEEDSNPDPNHPMNASEHTEVVQVLGQTLELPKALCAQPDVFWEFFSPDHLWNALPSETRAELMAKHLPQFSRVDDANCGVNDALEKETSLQMLFQREAFRFHSSPLVDFQRNLEEGNYLCDVVKYRAKIAKSERHAQRFQECDHISRVASKLAESRKALLDQVSKSPYQTQQNKTLNSDRSSRSSKELGPTLTASVAARARKRYKHEMTSIMAEANLCLTDSEAEEQEQEQAHFYGQHSLISNNNNNNNSSNNNRAHRKQQQQQGRPPSMQVATMTIADQLTETGESKVHGTHRSKSNSSYSVAEIFPKTMFNDDYLKHALRRHRKRKTEDPVSECCSHCNCLILFVAPPLILCL